MNNVGPQGLIISGEDIYDRYVEGEVMRLVSSDLLSPRDADNHTAHWLYKL